MSDEKPLDVGQLISEKIKTLKIMFPQGHGAFEALCGELVLTELRLNAALIILSASKDFDDQYEAAFQSAMTHWLDKEIKAREAVTEAQKRKTILQGV